MMGVRYPKVCECGYKGFADCPNVDIRMECVPCGYPLSEAEFPNDDERVCAHHRKAEIGDCAACGGAHLHEPKLCPYWGHEDDV